MTLTVKFESASQIALVMESLTWRKLNVFVMPSGRVLTAPKVIFQKSLNVLSCVIVCLFWDKFGRKLKNISVGFLDVSSLSELCDMDCGPYGRCESGKCHCDEGWSGAKCDVKTCDPRCHEHGQCKNGTCICIQGWNGRHCTLGEVFNIYLKF